MSLSNDVISQFAKTVNGKNKEKTESTVYGTVAIYGGQRYVKMDEDLCKDHWYRIKFQQL